MTTSLYYADPDGNQIELQVDNFATPEEGTAFIESEPRHPDVVNVPGDAVSRPLRAARSLRGRAPRWRVASR
jgi:hypothetical protein